MKTRLLKIFLPVIFVLCILWVLFVQKFVVKADELKPSITMLTNQQIVDGTVRIPFKYTNKYKGALSMEAISTEIDALIGYDAQNNQFQKLFAQDIGYSAGGIPIKVLLAGNYSCQTTNVLVVISGQHADEPAPRAAIMRILPEIVNSKTDIEGLGKDLMSTFVVFIPTINADGIERFAQKNPLSGVSKYDRYRVNDDYKNLNRDWGTQAEPEVAVAKGLIDYYQCQYNVNSVTVLDLHEYSPVVEAGKKPCLEIASPTTGVDENIYGNMLNISKYIRQDLGSRGISSRLVKRVRPSMGMCHAELAKQGIPTILVEGAGYQNGNIKNRAQYQYLVMRSAIHYLSVAHSEY